VAQPGPDFAGSSAPPRALLPLEPGQVHLWLAPVSAQDAAFVESRAPLLAADERERGLRFRHEPDRLRFFATRVMVRSVLSRHAAVAPADWLFEFNAHGRPQVAAGHGGAARLRFNVSHTDALVAVAVTAGAEVGVDVEDTSRPAPLPIADRFFSRSEATALQGLPVDERTQRFWKLWTLKESYIKARGLGLALALDSFSFDFDDAPDVRLVVDDDADDRPARWHFRHFAPDARHLVALCVEHDAGERVEVVVRGEQAATFAAAIDVDPAS
jgi:4'-phosphopantetheinyl transferase